MHAMSDDLVIYGAGGHGLVVAESASLAGFRVLGFVDSDPAKQNTTLGRWPVLDSAPDNAPCIVAVGNNAARHRLILQLLESGHTLASVIHPSAVVSPTAQIGDGVFVGPNAVVHVEAALGLGSIVNSAAVVEHHCRLQSAVHVAPGAILAGAVHVGQRTLIGAAAVVLPGRTIGDDCIIGAGSVVRDDVPANQTVAGNPARPIK
jgi:sugar O-acyltransferase (sialic acid O-acetyltransferase NeuD family)